MFEQILVKYKIVYCIHVINLFLPLFADFSTI